jgi:hypothetical protein
VPGEEISSKIHLGKGLSEGAGSTAACGAAHDRRGGMTTVTGSAPRGPVQFVTMLATGSGEPAPGGAGAMPCDPWGRAESVDETVHAFAEDAFSLLSLASERRRFRRYPATPKAPVASIVIDAGSGTAWNFAVVDPVTLNLSTATDR